MSDWNGIHGSIEIESKKYEIHSDLLGEFNRENIIQAACVGHALELSQENVSQGVKRASHVEGRMERIGDEQDPVVIVDYAHKPDALEKVLESLNQLKRSDQRIICLFGCGGDRDKSKRALMGKISSELSDEVWITSDNPRTEDPEMIIEQIRSGVSRVDGVFIEQDRRKAIEKAVARLGDKDVLLIAGKGHETYQEIGSERIPFDDRKEAILALRKRRCH